jgi:hypothetical protein
VTVSLARKFPFYQPTAARLTVSNRRFSKKCERTLTSFGIVFFVLYCYDNRKKYSDRVYRICVASAHSRGYSGDNKAQCENQDTNGHFPSGQRKVFADLGRSSHNAMWQRNHLLVFKASWEWLTHNSVNGTKEA